MTGSRPPRSLVRHLDKTGLFRVTLAPEPPADLGRHQVVIAAGPQRPLGAERAAALVRFVSAGGGLVTVGVAAGWSAEPALGALLGRTPVERSPAAELVFSPVPGHPITDRLDPEISLTDRIHLDLQPPPGATVILTVRWRYSTRPVGFIQEFGSGRHAHLELGGLSEAMTAPAFEQLVHRCLRYAARRPEVAPTGVGLLGYGAIGREHAAAIQAVSGLELRAICDSSPARRAGAAAEAGVPVHAALPDLLADPDVDLVVVGVPPVAHAEAVLAVLAAGKHAVCEKPFAITAAETAAMIEAADRSGRVLTVYQSRRWDPDFSALRGAVAAGEIGDPFYMESFIGGYGHPCGYWHSHEAVSGGTIYDWGSHYFDWVLLTFPAPVTSVSAVAHKLVWHDVTNSDQVRVDLSFADGAQATFLQSDIAAALKPKWYLLGTRGAILGEWRQESVTSRAWTGDLVEERLQPAESPALVRVLRPDGRGGTHEQRLALPERVRNGFYRNLADHRCQGEPLAVPAAEAARTVAVMEAATTSAAAGGRPLKVRI